MVDFRIRGLVLVCGLACARASSASELHLDHCTMSIAGARIAMTGTIVLEPLSVDLHGYAPRWRLGAITLREVVATAHDHGNAIHACVAGDLGGSRVLACGELPRSRTELLTLRGVDLTWRITGELVHGNGLGRLALGPHVPTLEVSTTHLKILGGEITSDPLILRAGTDAVLHVHGIDLAQLLALLGHGHVTATGTLDGELALHAGDGVAITRGNLRARRGGVVHVLGLPVDERIALTLSDFAYNQLSVIVHPAGTDPEVELAMRGHGERIDQEIDLNVNVHGVRDVIGMRLP